VWHWESSSSTDWGCGTVTDLDAGNSIGTRHSSHGFKVCELILRVFGKSGLF